METQNQENKHGGINRDHEQIRRQLDIKRCSDAELRRVYDESLAYINAMQSILHVVKEELASRGIQL